MPQNDTDHDLLITLNTKLDALISKLDGAKIPETCYIHSSKMDELQRRIDSLEESLKWAWRLAIGSIITASLGIIIPLLLSHFNAPNTNQPEKQNRGENKNVSTSIGNYSYNTMGNISTYILAQQIQKTTKRSQKLA